jgi:hypothetical protein
MIVGKKVSQEHDSANNAKKECVEKFVAYAVTDMRLRQGLESVMEQSHGDSAVKLLLEKKNIPRLFKWVLADVVKEEGGVMREMVLTEKR